MSCIKTLKKKGFKLTPQRRLIVGIIHDAEGHLTAEHIIKNVQNRMPGVNKSTIYRTLDVLEEAGCVYKSEAQDQIIYHHAEEGHHHHLICRNCGGSISCDEDLFSTVEKFLFEKYNFQVTFKHLVINGLCDRCKNTTK
jgi:Fur family ferric uptake transcriptional regulator